MSFNKTEEDCKNLAKKIFLSIDESYTPKQRVEIMTQLLIGSVCFANNKQPNNILITIDNEKGSVEVITDISVEFHTRH